MINLPYEINGESFSDIVHKYGYATDTVPVYSRVVTTLDGVDHQHLLRVRGTLTITTNPVKPDRAAAFCSALRALPGKVKYYSFQTGQVVEQTMRLTGGMPLAVALQNGDTRWLDGMSLTIEQL